MNGRPFFSVIIKSLRFLFGIALAIELVGLQPAGIAFAAPQPDLIVTKTDSPDPVLVGSTLTYRVVVKNQGNAKANSTVMTDTLPGGLTFGPVTTTKGSCTRTNNIVRCSLNKLNGGASAKKPDVPPLFQRLHFTNLSRIFLIVCKPDLCYISSPTAALFDSYQPHQGLFERA